MTTPILEVRGVAKSFGRIAALRGADLRIGAGEAVGLVGENGAGKSTLIKIVSGAEQADTGEVRFAGEPAEFRSPHAAQLAGIATVHQRNWLVGGMTVLQNLELAHEPVRTPLRWLRRAPRRQSTAALETVGLAGCAGRRVDSLPLADRQLVSVARALAAGGRLMILDEPTAALSPAEVERLFAVIRRVRAAGMALVYVTHRLEELPEVVDRIAVMRDGRIVAESEPDAGEARLVELMTGQEALRHERELTESRHRRMPAAVETAAEPLLRAEGLRDHDEAFAGIDFELARGEVLALVGLPDSGVEELAETLAGARRFGAGRLTIDGAAAHPRSPRQAISRGIGFLAGDRPRKGIIPNSSVRTAVTLSSLGRVGRFGVIQRRREASLSKRMLDLCQVRAGDVEASIATLSGGNQQKALLARVLATEPRVLVVQDPTAGVDVAGREGFYDLISDFCLAGAGVVWSSSDLREVTVVSDRALVFWRGRIVAELRRGDLSVSALMSAQFNVADDALENAVPGAPSEEEG